MLLLVEHLIVYTYVDFISENQMSNLIVRERHYSKEMSVEDAIKTMLCSMSSGELESLRDRIENIERMLAVYLGMKIKKVSQLNELAGFERFEEVIR
jgi:hypothetical protein